MRRRRRDRKNDRRGMEQLRRQRARDEEQREAGRSWAVHHIESFVAGWTEAAKKGATDTTNCRQLLSPSSLLLYAASRLCFPRATAATARAAAPVTARPMRS